MSKMVPKVRFGRFSGDWKQVKLGEFAIIKGRLGWKSLKQDEYTTDGPSMVAGKHIKNGVIDWERVDHIPQWRYDESPEIMLENGDIIFSKDGSLGNPALISNLKSPATINSTMMLIRLNEEISPSFFYQILVGRQFHKLIYLKVSGSSIPHLFQADMNDFNFSTTNILEQQKIGALFKQIDDTIALQQQLVEQQQQYKKAMLQKMFPQKGERVPKVRFDGFSENWTELKMGEVFEQTNEYINPQESNLELFSLTVEKGLTQKTARYNREFLVKKVDKFKKVSPNEFVYNPMNMTLGAVGFNDSKFSVAVSGYYVTMKIKMKCNNEYFRIVLTSPQAIRLYKLYATGSLIEKQRVQFSTFSEIRVKVPVLEEQQKIGAFFKQLDDTISLHQKKLEDYQQLKKALLQRMFV